MSVLEEICAQKRALVAQRKRTCPQAELERLAADASPPRGFASNLWRVIAEGGYGLIAEIKRASPSKGLIRADFDPPVLASAYEAGGATCISVLTDGPYFQGDDAFLIAARAAVSLPVLRKDFLLDPYQIIESRAIGADAVLLILAAIDDGCARELRACAFDLGMDTLVEVHDETEMRRAVALDCTFIGINNRNLATLSVDLATTERLAPFCPGDRLLVSESGLFAHVDFDRMARAGVRCFLVGESLMRQPDVAEATRALLAPTP
ncbi:MAG: indole-3-glycerol phosphate synthase TrpC [Rhodospirillales bacterium]|nr:indole-3-glycerol phosphate synthase TrpC [Rhodospirillales bacterium]